MFARLFAAVFILAISLFPGTVAAQETTPSAQVAWRLLDYIAVDYPEAVTNGRITNAAEYAEMTEFSASVRERLALLEPVPNQPGLVQQADGLITAIERKAPASEVAGLARTLATDLLTAYPTPLAPAQAPDPLRAINVYAEQCSGCHGATGMGDGRDAKGLDPPPVIFTDVVRARERSVFGLYQVIGQGLEGTAMESFSDLPDEERWALAFYVGGFAFDERAAKAGGRLWKSDPVLRAQIPNLQTLTQTTPAALAAALGEPKATQITAFLRRHPDEAASHDASSLSIAWAKLAQCLAAYEAGDRKAARDLALAAYLDGFEPVEPALTARDSALVARVESAMGELRAGLSKGASVAAVREQVERVEALLNAAEQALAPEAASPASSFAGAFMILLREGLEALLIVIAMIAFLGKAGRRDVLPYVHAGWASALAAGALTWAAATYLVSITGASRELAEGVGSLVSAVVLISVGIWMHGKAHAGAWQAYIKEKLSAALSRRSAWFLFLLAFLVVYREVFETILFYAALWSQGGRIAMLFGAGAAVLALAVIAWALLRYSKRLPISEFFTYSSWLISALAVVLAGKGVSALQEAGLLDIRPLSFLPRIEILGVYPTWEGLAAQLLTLAVLVFGFWMSGRKQAETTT